MGPGHNHFHGKSAAEHLSDVRAKNRMLSEPHGTEIPAPVPAAADAAREASVSALLIWVLLQHFSYPTASIALVLVVFGSGFVFWKTARAAWLTWSRLERLHRVVKEERHEISTNREAEREELIALYKKKGIDGPLLEELVDVLMADDDVLLAIMLEEEMGFTLESYEHPLKQALGAFVGSLSAHALFVAAFLLFPTTWACAAVAFVVVGLGGYASARFENNAPIPAVVWNLAMAAFTLVLVTYGLDLAWEIVDGV